jgi:hypothetical protein
MEPMGGCHLRFHVSALHHLIVSRGKFTRDIWIVESGRYPVQTTKNLTGPLELKQWAHKEPFASDPISTQSIPTTFSYECLIPMIIGRCGTFTTLTINTSMGIYSPKSQSWMGLDSMEIEGSSFIAMPCFTPPVDYIEQ